MITDVPLETFGRNKLLALLPEASRGRLAPHLKLRDLPHKFVVHEPYGEVKELYFPLSGVISWIVTMKNGSMAEAMTIGNEGVSGISVALGGHRGSTASIVQAPGFALVIEIDQFVRLLDEDRALFRAMQYYANVLINVVAQCAACNRLHEVTERCARWLLMMHDRAESEEFILVQEFLADMLGVHRPTVSVCASILQRAGFISYKRGRVRVMDRAGLESAACECYRVVADEYVHMLEDLARLRAAAGY
ncbi:MAG: Crp/Fnr family transcriptional regulator [Candidatus Eremiobacteraeota bacterium]|nr:Crp/Fnr family transcriptional regulator [Candidatus Eremiobacteraeota bacterium]